MDKHSLEYFSSYSTNHAGGHFHRVIALHDNPLIKWEEAYAFCPSLCRGWYELAHLSLKDRLEFLREFWLAKLTYAPELCVNLVKFFDSLDDIGVFLTQQKFDDPFQPVLVYSLAKNNGFFHGNCGATEEEIQNLQKDFPDYILPVDYLSFLKIHNGFAKCTDTGIIPSRKMKTNYEAFQEMLQNQDGLMSSTGSMIDPKNLIPFYESFGMPFYQCFWSEWYPEQEMGNVYYSGRQDGVSPTSHLPDAHKNNDSTETLAFETFILWLVFYLEKVE